MRQQSNAATAETFDAAQQEASEVNQLPRRGRGGSSTPQPDDGDQFHCIPVGASHNHLLDRRLQGGFEGQAKGGEEGGARRHNSLGVADLRAQTLAHTHLKYRSNRKFRGDKKKRI